MSLPPVCCLFILSLALPLSASPWRLFDVFRHSLDRDVTITTPESGPRDHVTCWTCANKTDNEACNNWAPDLQCPLAHSVCKTTHRLNIVTMETQLVNKACSVPEECGPAHIGCHDSGSDPDVKECVTCCVGDYCNEQIADDPLSAVALSSLPNYSSTDSSASSHEFSLSCTVILAVSRFLLWIQDFYISIKY